MSLSVFLCTFGCVSMSVAGGVGSRGCVRSAGSGSVCLSGPPYLPRSGPPALWPPAPPAAESWGPPDCPSPPTGHGSRPALTPGVPGPPHATPPSWGQGLRLGLGAWGLGPDQGDAGHSHPHQEPRTGPSPPAHTHRHKHVHTRACAHEHMQALHTTPPQEQPPAIVHHSARLAISCALSVPGCAGGTATHCLPTALTTRLAGRCPGAPEAGREPGGTWRAHRGLVSGMMRARPKRLHGAGWVSWEPHCPLIHTHTHYTLVHTLVHTYTHLYTLLHTYTLHTCTHPRVLLTPLGLHTLACSLTRSQPWRTRGVWNCAPQWGSEAGRAHAHGQGRGQRCEAQ